MENLRQEERAKLLQFITGTSQVPLGGFSKFNPRLRICKRLVQDKLPISHTCFNTIDLPMYSSYEKLQQSLHTAIMYGSEGFAFS